MYKGISVYIFDLQVEGVDLYIFMLKCIFSIQCLSDVPYTCDACSKS